MVGKKLAFLCFNLHFFSGARALMFTFVSSMNCLFILLPIFLWEYFFFAIFIIWLSLLLHIFWKGTEVFPYECLHSLEYLSIFVMYDWQFAWYVIFRSHCEAGKVLPDFPAWAFPLIRQMCAPWIPSRSTPICSYQLPLLLKLPSWLM